MCTKSPGATIIRAKKQENNTTNNSKNNNKCIEMQDTPMLYMSHVITNAKAEQPGQQEVMNPLEGALGNSSP